MTEAEIFVTNFHNLQGLTVADKKRNFFHLLHTNFLLHQNSALLDTIISQLNVPTHLEKLFLVDLLIYFRRYQELSKEFLQGNDIVVSKISKERWFFEKLFKENAAQFVDKFLPRLSYSLRIKVLKRLVLILNEEQSDAIFDDLHERYGIFIASNILTGCSCNKIEHILRNHPITLWTSQLKLLYNKQPQLLCTYFEERVQNEGNAEFLNDNPIVSFIAMKDPEMFCYLLEKYKFENGKVGKRCTKKIVRTKQVNVLTKPQLYAKNLNAARFVRQLGTDFENVYFQLFPKEVDSVFSSWNDAGKLLNYYPKRRRFPLFKQTFAITFYDSLEFTCKSLENCNFNYIMEMVTDPEEREKWASLKYENDKNDQYLKYYTPQKCLNILIPKLNIFSEVEKRAEYIEAITESCLISKDWKSLISVCELLCKRLKNDPIVYSRFLQTLLYPKFGEVFNYLDENHWKCIKKIILKSGQVTSGPTKILTRRRRFTPDNDCSGTVTLKYFEFLSKQDKLTQDEMIELMQRVSWISCLKDFKFNSNTGKKILLFMIQVAPQALHDTDTIEKVDVELILACKKYHSDYPHQSIFIFDNARVVHSIKTVISSKEFDDNDKLASVVEWIICSNKSNIDEELIQVYWDNFEELATFNLTLWFLNHRPNLVMTKIETFVNVVTAKTFLANNYYHLVTNPIWRLVKCYSHLQIDQSVVENCMNKLSDEDFDEKTSLAEPLSIIMSSEDFVKLVEGYKPSTTTVNLLDEEEKSKFWIKRFLLKSLINANAPQDVASLLLQFLSGDYVAACISPLYSCLYQIPEDEVKIILDKLCMTGAVSVKKHGFYFICATQDEATILHKLQSCRLSQSIAMSYQHFTKNPSELSWELVKKKLTKLDNNDHFTCMLLVNKPAPKPYKAAYFEEAFEIFREKRNRFTKVLVDKLPEEVIGQLTNRFFTNLKDDFLTMKKSDLIVSYYLLYCPEVFKYDVTFGALRLFKEKQWSLRSHEAREKLKDFVMTFYTVYMKWDKTDVSLVTTFLEEFVKIFPPVEAFEEYIILSLMQFKNQSTSDLSKSLIALHNSSVNCYGKLIFEIFANCFNQVVDKICSSETGKFELYNSLLECKKSIEDELLIIYMLPRKRPPLKDSALLYLKILDLLKNEAVKNEVVLLHLRQHLDRQEAENRST